MRGLGLSKTLALLALAVGVSGSDASVAGQTRVRILEPSPLTLRGVGFAPAERVRLTVSLGERTAARTLRAGLAGRFTTSFPTMHYGRCAGSLAVKAVGSRDNRVSWELVPLECPDRADS